MSLSSLSQLPHLVYIAHIKFWLLHLNSSKTGIFKVINNLVYLFIYFFTEIWLKHSTQVQASFSPGIFTDWIYLWDHYSDQDVEHFQYPRILLCVFSCLLPSSKGSHFPDQCHHASVFLLEFHGNGIIKFVLLWLDSFIQIMSVRFICVACRNSLLFFIAGSFPLFGCIVMDTKTFSFFKLKNNAWLLLENLHCEIITQICSSLGTFKWLNLIFFPQSSFFLTSVNYLSLLTMCCFLICSSLLS